MFGEKVQKFVQKINSNRSLALAGILLLVIAIPFTVYIENQEQELRQHADTNQATITVTPTKVSSGETLTVVWTIPQAQSSLLPSFEVVKSVYAQTDTTPTPASTSSGSTSGNLTGAETLQLVFLGKSTDGQGGIQFVGSGLYLNCQPVNTVSRGEDRQIIPASPIYTGSCYMTVPQEAPAGSYVVRLLASDGKGLLGESSPISVETGSSQLSAYPNPCMLTDYGTCSSVISWNVPNATNAADVMVKLKEYPNSLFANAPFGSIKAGWITEKGVTFELYIGSSKTPVDSVFVKGVSFIPPPPKMPVVGALPENIPSCMSDKDCSGKNMKCFKYQDYPGTCKSADTVCTAAITTACYQNPQTTCNQNGGCADVVSVQPKCIDFPNLCMVPPGWSISKTSDKGSNDNSGGATATPVPTATTAPTAVPTHAPTSTPVPAAAAYPTNDPNYSNLYDPNND